MPASRPLLLAVPGPDPASRDVDSQLSARAVAQDAARPVLRRNALGQFFDRDRRRGGLLRLRRAPAARLGGGNMEAGLLGPDALVAMHVGDENLVRILEPPQKARLLAITAVDADPREPDPPGARPAPAVEGMSTPRTPRPDNCRFCPAAPSNAAPPRPSHRPAWESCSRRG